MDRDFAPTPWEPLPEDESARPGQSWRGAALRLAALFILLPAVAFGGLYLAVSGASGKVTFGSAAVSCALGGQTSSISEGDPTYAAVILDRGVTPGEVLTMRLLAGEELVSEITFRITGPGNCDTQLVDDGSLIPGHYRVTFSVGSEQLADGEFEVVPASR